MKPFPWPTARPAWRPSADLGRHPLPETKVLSLLGSRGFQVAVLLLLAASALPALEPLNEGGAPRPDCKNIPAYTDVKLVWRGQNLAGCKVELSAASSRIHRVGSDCTTTLITDLPPSVPRAWSILSQPAGGGAQVTATTGGATLSLPRAGDYTVQLVVCPGGGCQVLEFAGSTNTFLLNASTGYVTLRAEAELPLPADRQPVLPPSAMQGRLSDRLDLTDAERACRCQGGGGLVNPQWVTVSNWSGASDYRLLEGYVLRSWAPVTDSPINHDLAFFGGDWYVINDINVVVSPDPKFYPLVSTKPEWELNPHLIGCETPGQTMPDQLRPVEGDRISLFGFWILDCGHPPFYTEIHPIVGWGVHRNRPVRIPDTAVFPFDLGTTQVVSTAGQNLYVPGVVTDVWFNSDTGEITNGDPTSLALPARCNPDYATCALLNPPCPKYLDADRTIRQSPIQREYDFNVYLPRNPSQAFAEVGLARPRAPLYLKISNPYGSSGPDPVVTRMTETTNGVTYEYLRVHVDLRSQAAATYSRRIEAAWVYPKADNWGLTQWRVALDRMDIYDDLDSKLRWPGDAGDWILWFMLPGVGQAWTRVLDGFDNTQATIQFNPRWSTGSLDPVFWRPPLSVDPLRRLGPDILTYNNWVNFWMGGYEADEGFNGDPGRIQGFVYNSGATNRWFSHNSNFSVDVVGTRVATLTNGVLSAAAVQLGRQYLLTCTNRIRPTPPRDVLDPQGMAGPQAEGISGEPPWSPVDPLRIYGLGAALPGDLNRDGFPDMALGARGSNFEAHVFLGGRNGFPPAPHAVVSLAIPGVTNGFLSVTQRPPNLLGPGDLNGDGIPDLLVGVPTYLNGTTTNGALFAFSGAQLGVGGPLGNSNAFWSVLGGYPNAQFATAVAAGDINRDGFSDVLVGAPYFQNSTTILRPLGRVFLYLGSATGLPALPTHSVFPPQLVGSLHWFGSSLSVAGDMNGDGFLDVVVGAPRYSNGQVNEGAIFVYYGSTTGLVFNTYTVLEGNVAGAQFGYAVAGAGDVDGDGLGDILVGAPFFTADDVTVEQGYAAVFRGTLEGVGGSLWGRAGGIGGARFGSDLGPVGDMNGDGLADVAVGAPGEVSPDGLLGRVSYFPGTRVVASGGTESWRSWGVSGVARLAIKPPCCNVGTNRTDINADGFSDALTFDPSGAGDPIAAVQLLLGRGQRSVVPALDRFLRAGAVEPYTLPEVFNANFAADMVSSGQTNETKLAALLARIRNLYFNLQLRGVQPGSIVPLLQQLQAVTPPHLFQQYFGDVDLELGTSFYIDCGATSETVDALGRRWLPDGPYLAQSNTVAVTYTNGAAITNSLLTDFLLPQSILRRERWLDGNLRYQIAVPTGWYRVILYFSENSPSLFSPLLGGTGCSNCARIFDLEVEGQRINGYNPADAARPPAGDGLGALYTATQVPFSVQVTDGLLDVAVLDRGAGNPPGNAAINAIAILARPAPGRPLPRPVVRVPAREESWLSLTVGPQSGLGRYLAGELGIRLESSLDLRQWVPVPALPALTAKGAVYSLTVPTNRATFYRGILTNAPGF